MAGTGPPGPGRTPSPADGGSGWRGPESTCPGRGGVEPAGGIGFAAGTEGRPGAITAAGGAGAFGAAGSGGMGGATAGLIVWAGWLTIGG